LTKRLFVGNLSFNVSEDELMEAFSQFGATEVAIPVNESGRPKGFGFVTIPADQADVAIQAMDGKDLAGRIVAVNEARPREPRGGGVSRTAALKQGAGVESGPDRVGGACQVGGERPK